MLTNYIGAIASSVYDRAGRGMAAEAHLYLGMEQQRVWLWKRGISLDISLAWNAGRLCSPFSRGCTKPLKGRERGRRIALS